MVDAADICMRGPDRRIVIRLRQGEKGVVVPGDCVDRQIRWQHRAIGEVHSLGPPLAGERSMCRLLARLKALAAAAVPI